MHSYEVNFDGLVGPTHNYAGLSFGNVASKRFAAQPSNPKQAALQGLEKMRRMRQLGLHQGVLAPHARPHMALLKQLGFTGSDAQILEKAYKYNPTLLSACFSSSAMWSANAATVSPSSDSADNRVHFTAANLSNKLHRSIEAPTTGRVLQATFANSNYFAHHAPLPGHDHFADEGAANHTRLCPKHGDKGLHLFVYGREAFSEGGVKPQKFPARHTLEASAAIARLHQLDDSQQLYIQQNPEVIDQGVFHNDVIAVGNEQLLFCHEQAFYKQHQALDTISSAYSALYNDAHRLSIVEVPTEAVSVADAVSSYLFNSQLITLPSNATALIAPQECAENPAVKAYLDDLLTQPDTLDEVHYVDIKQSMQNGGGPACLRLRVVLTEQELAATNPACLFSDKLHHTLSDWVKRHYRDQLCQDDLRDPLLIQESYAALDELTKLMNLGSIYDFQQ